MPDILDSFHFSIVSQLFQRSGRATRVSASTRPRLRSEKIPEILDAQPSVRRNTCREILTGRQKMPTRIGQVCF
jgi:hypothetical protein